jgi:hypothetical protein
MQTQLTVLGRHNDDTLRQDEGNINCDLRALCYFIDRFEGTSSKQWVCVGIDLVKFHNHNVDAMLIPTQKLRIYIKVISRYCQTLQRETKE